MVIASEAFRTQEENRRQCLLKLGDFLQSIAVSLEEPLEPSKEQQQRVKSLQKKFESTRLKEKKLQSSN